MEDAVKPKAKVKGAIIKVNHKWCKGCTICASFCSKKVFTPNKMGHPMFSPDDNECIMCMLCVERCPDFAIEVTKKPEDVLEKE